MAAFWHIPTILGAATLGGLSYTGVVKDNWTSTPVQVSNNTSVWSDVNNGSGLARSYGNLERARTRDFSEMIVKMGNGVKRVVAPGSANIGGQYRDRAAVLGNPDAYIGDSWWNGTTTNARKAQPSATTSRNAWQNNSPSSRATNRQLTTTQQRANTQTNTQRTNTQWANSQTNSQRGFTQSNSQPAYIPNNSRSNTSRQVASNAPSAPLPAGEVNAFGQAGGFRIAIETDGGMQEAKLIEQQLRKAGYRSVESWQKPNDGRVRIFVGEQMAPDLSDREFSKLAKTLRTFTFYSDVTLLQL